MTMFQARDFDDDGNVFEADLNMYAQHVGYVAHRLYRLAEGAEHIYHSTKPVNRGRVQSIVTYLYELTPQEVWARGIVDLFNSYQKWCIEGSGKERPEFPAYVGSDGREHGEY